MELVMWLSPNGNIRMDETIPGKFRVFRWSHNRQSWVYWFDSAMTSKLQEFQRVMKLTKYPDAPDYPPR